MKIHAGALCKVIGGTDGLNVGKTVEVTQLRGELVTEYGGLGITADFAESWLQPIPPGTAKPQQQKAAA